MNCAYILAASLGSVSPFNDGIGSGTAVSTGVNASKNLVRLSGDNIGEANQPHQIL